MSKTQTAHALTKERTPFGHTGVEVSPLGFGGAPIGLLETDAAEVERLLNFLLDEGVNLIDTAAAYEDSETLIGNAISQRRDEYLLVSKCGDEVADLEGAAWSPELITQTIDRALRRLRTDHLDVMLLHSCGLEVLKAGAAFGALMDARQAGKVRFVGYSGDNKAATYAAGIPELDVLETSLNICDQANLDGGIARARERGLGVIAKRSIANAAWKNADAQPEFYADYAAPYAERLKEMNLDLSALGFDGPPEEAWPELALRFTLSHPGVHTAILGTTKLENARANLQAAEKGPLPDDVVQSVQQAFRMAALRSADGWSALV